MASELVHYEGADSWANMLEPVARLAQIIAPTEFVNRAYRGKPASVAAAVLTGRGLGFDPLTSIRVLHVIEGQVSLSADAMLGLCQRAGHSVEWLESTDKAAELRMTRGDGLGSAHVRYTMRDAERAGDAQKRNYQKYPRAMLRARAITECVRMVAADILLGVDATDALDEQQQRPSDTTQTVQLKSSQRVVTAESVAHTDEEVSPVVSPTLPSEGMTETIPHDELDESPLVTREQLRKLNAQITELEHRDGRKLSKDERRSIILTLAGADGLESALELSREQASQAIDSLEQTLRTGEQDGSHDGDTISGDVDS